MSTRKSEHHEAIRERAREALRDLYHNATVRYPRETFGRSDDYFDSWFYGECESALDYVRSGGAYGPNYRRTLEAPCNAGRYTSNAARLFYIRHGMRKMREERERCNNRDSRIVPVNRLWECIDEFGTLSQWGRGGRTLAPDSLVSRRGGSSFGIKEDAFDSCPIAECVHNLRIIESFNRFVSDWCASVPELWREHCEVEDAEERNAKRKSATRKAKETRERNYWASRDVATV